MTTKAETEFQVLNTLGLHARAAAQLVKIANRHKCDVSLECEGQTVNGKSIMGVLMLAAAQGMHGKVSFSGEGAAQCPAERGPLFNGLFGEPN